MKKILITEDEKQLAKALKIKLENAGFETFHAGNGRDAVEKVALIKPDLVIMDLFMPQMDGATAIKELRANDENKDLLIYCLSNISDLESYDSGLRNLVDIYDVKSDVLISEVANKIKRILK